MDRIDMSKVVSAAAIVVCFAAAGIVMRMLFSSLVRRSRRSKGPWAEAGWRLAVGLSVPTTLVIGLWVVVQILPLDPPAGPIVDKSLLAFTVLVVAWSMARVVAAVMRSVITSRAAAQSATIFISIARVAVIGLGLLVLLQSFGVSIHQC